MSFDAVILVGLLFLAAAMLRPSARHPAGEAARPPDRPRPLGPTVGPYERWAAERKGQEMLGHLLTADEYAILHARGYLEVASPTVAGRVYRIPRRRGLVEQVEGARVATRLCVVPDRWLPDADIVLMHKLLIEADEARYLRVANPVGPHEADAAAKAYPLGAHTAAPAGVARE